jgi:hypothetical protein
MAAVVQQEVIVGELENSPAGKLKDDKEIGGDAQVKAHGLTIRGREEGEVGRKA